MDQFIGKIVMADGDSVALDATCQHAKYLITGSPVLTTNWAVTFTGTPYEGMSFKFTYSATPTVGSNTITILGTAIPATYLAKKLKIEADYIGSAWVVFFRPSWDEADLIAATHVLAGILTNTHFSALAASALALSKVVGSTKGKAIYSDPTTGLLAESTMTSAEQTLLAGLTASSAELNALDGTTVVANDVELLAGAYAAGLRDDDLLVLIGANLAGLTANDLLTIKGLYGLLSITTNDITFLKGIGRTSREVASNDTIEDYDDILICDVPAGTDLTLTLPSGSTGKKTISIIVRVNATPHNLVLSPVGGDTIDTGGAGDQAVATITTPAVDTLITLCNYTAGKWSYGKS